MNLDFGAQGFRKIYFPALGGPYITCMYGASNPGIVKSISEAAGSLSIPFEEPERTELHWIPIADFNKLEIMEKAL